MPGREDTLKLLHESKIKREEPPTFILMHKYF